MHKTADVHISSPGNITIKPVYNKSSSGTGWYKGYGNLWSERTPVWISGVTPNYTNVSYLPVLTGKHISRSNRFTLKKYRQTPPGHGSISTKMWTQKYVPSRNRTSILQPAVSLCRRYVLQQISFWCASTFHK